MGLTVVTHTRYNRGAMLDRCIESVANGLPNGAVHRVVPCFEDWGKARLDAVLSDEFVAFVDDDDTIAPSALQHCLDVMKATDVGIVCTDEVVVDENLKVVVAHEGRKVYIGQAATPRMLHHLCVVRSSTIDPVVLSMHRKYGAGVDWFIKSCAAFTKGAIHIPMQGYFWTNHSGCMTHDAHEQFKRDQFAMSDDIRATWTVPEGPIPQYDPVTKVLTTFVPGGINTRSLKTG